LGVNPPPRKRMKVHRHEPEDMPVLFDAALESRAALVRGEANSCVGSVAVQTEGALHEHAIALTLEFEANIYEPPIVRP
jgi:tRNA(Met) C34 N-acetyltransferase TmcA